MDKDRGTLRIGVREGQLVTIGEDIFLSAHRNENPDAESNPILLVICAPKDREIKRTGKQMGKGKAYDQ